MEDFRKTEGGAAGLSCLRTRPLPLVVSVMKFFPQVFYSHKISHHEAPHYLSCSYIPPSSFKTYRSPATYTMIPSASPKVLSLVRAESRRKRLSPPQPHSPVFRKHPEQAQSKKQKHEMCPYPLSAAILCLSPFSSIGFCNGELIPVGFRPVLSFAKDRGGSF